MMKRLFNFKTALSALIIFFSLSKVAAADQVLVIYFNKLFKGQAQACPISDDKKSSFLFSYEPSCLVRSSYNGEQYISGVKAECSESTIKATVANQITAYCQSVASAESKAQNNQDAKGKSSNSGESKSSNSGGSGGLDLAQAGNLIYEGVKKWSDNKSTHQTASGSSDSSQAKATASNSSNASNTPSAQSSSSSSSNNLPPIEDHSIYGNSPSNSGNASNAGSASNSGNASTPAPINDVNQAKADYAKSTPDAQKAASELSGPAGEAAAKSVQNTPEGVEAQAEEAGAGAAEAAKKADAELVKQVKTLLQKIETSCNHPNVSASAKNIDQAVESREKIKFFCKKSNTAANFMCPLTTNPSVLDAQKVMSIGATALSAMTSASESCGTTSNISKVAQSGMLLGQLTCLGAKKTCDMTCESSEAKRKEINPMIDTLKQALTSAVTEYSAEIATEPLATKCESVYADPEQVGKLLDQDGTNIQTKIAECQKHSANLALMAMSAAGLLSAANDGQKCKKQLSSGEGGDGEKPGGGGAQASAVSTADYCASPINANSVMCKCTTNPSADGCLGSVNNNGIGFDKINNGGSSSSGFAGTGLKSADTGLSAADKAILDQSNKASASNLSQDAREALGVNSVAGLANGSGAANRAGSQPSSGSDKDASKDNKENKSKFGGFFSSIGSMLTGGSGKKPTASGNTTYSDQQTQAIKRKLASDGVRAEISTASGKSNFDKISNRYRDNFNSFEQ